MRTMGFSKSGAFLLLVATTASAESYLYEIAKQEPYKTAYKEMLSFPEWVSNAQGTSTPIERVTADGKRYMLGHMCKPHDCADHQLSVVFSADGKQSWGLLATRSADGKTFYKQLLGHPDRAVEALLNTSFADNNPEDGSTRISARVTQAGLGCLHVRYRSG
ncbi:Ivy family c-type lysozyme inhibitor [Pseudomonas psychrophila]|nr:Ivy family c-type lysozyme inhibitor [Pseudomonas psychrophila]